MPPPDASSDERFAGPGDLERNPTSLRDAIRHYNTSRATPLGVVRLLGAITGWTGGYVLGVAGGILSASVVFHEAYHYLTIHTRSTQLHLWMPFLALIGLAGGIAVGVGVAACAFKGWTRLLRLWRRKTPSITTKALEAADRRHGWRPRADAPLGDHLPCDRYLPVIHSNHSARIAFTIERWAYVDTAESDELSTAGGWQLVDSAVVEDVEPDDSVALGEARARLDLQAEQLTARSADEWIEAHEAERTRASAEADAAADAAERRRNADETARLLNDC